MLIEELKKNEWIRVPTSLYLNILHENESLKLEIEELKKNKSLNKIDVEKLRKNGII